MNPYHASAIMLEGRAIMLTGAAGSGKSSLALQLIEHYGATLIGDDRLILSVDGAGIHVAPHATLAGLLELRGLGLMRLPYAPSAPLGLVINLQEDAPPRLAEADYFTFADESVPLLAMRGADATTALRIKYAAQALKNGFRQDAIYRLD